MINVIIKSMHLLQLFLHLITYLIIIVYFQKNNDQNCVIDLKDLVHCLLDMNKKNLINLNDLTIIHYLYHQFKLTI